MKIVFLDTDSYVDMDDNLFNEQFYFNVKKLLVAH